MYLNQMQNIQPRGICKQMWGNHFFQVWELKTKTNKNPELNDDLIWEQNIHMNHFLVNPKHTMHCNQCSPIPEQMIHTSRFFFSETKTYNTANVV